MPSPISTALPAALPAALTNTITTLRSTTTVRQRAQALLARARRGASAHFTVDDTAMPAAANLVASVTRERYPHLRIPFHSRWRHFEAGGVDRKAWLDATLAPRLAGLSEVQRARAASRTYIDLALVSVLLDAGAGPQWAYREADTSFHAGRSEGLGVASFHAFMAGLFSSDSTQPLQADAQGLQAITAEALARAFQVTPHNPLVGLEGRAALLRALGHALHTQSAVFGTPGRPGGLLDTLLQRATPGLTIHAHDVLVVLLNTLSGIWPAANQIDGVPVGDCWLLPELQEPTDLTEALGSHDGSQSWMPFHKLSQWLTYSLLEPLQWAGVEVQGLDALTGLPEYRNGGLLLDAGVLRCKDAAATSRSYTMGDGFIVEWRALTVALLDEIAPLVRAQLGLTADQMPLACVLEGGTWAAGRVLASNLRGGTPPLHIQSDGTVF